MKLWRTSSAVARSRESLVRAVGTQKLRGKVEVPAQTASAAVAFDERKAWFPQHAVDLDASWD